MKIKHFEEVYYTRVLSVLSIGEFFTFTYWMDGWKDRFFIGKIINKNGRFERCGGKFNTIEAARESLSA